MTRHEEDTEKLRSLLLTWDVRLIHVEASYHASNTLQDWTERKSFFAAPFTSGLGLDWEERAVVAVPTTPWANILHEAGHLLLDTNPPNGRIVREEIDWFGWEWAVVCYLDLYVPDFLKPNAEYCINWQDADGTYYDEVRHLTRPEVRERFLAERLAFAQEIGYVDAAGVPLVPRH